MTIAKIWNNASSYNIMTSELAYFKVTWHPYVTKKFSSMRYMQSELNNAFLKEDILRL